MPKVILKPKPNYDLLPKNPYPLLLKCESTKVNVEIEIETAKPNTAKTDRWTKVAEQEMERYRDIVTDTVEKVTKDWDQKPLAERKKDAETLSKSIDKAYQSMEGAIEKAVEVQIKREAQGDKNLLEARIAVAAKGTFKVIAIGADIAELAVSGGANVKAWYALAKDIYALAELIYKQCMDEAKLRNALLEAIGKYSSLKQRRFNEAEKAQDWKSKAKLFAKEFWKSEKSLADKAESSRKEYRNEVTSLIQKNDSVGDKADKLTVLLNKSGDVDAVGIAKGKQMIDLKTSVKDMNNHILSCQSFLDDMSYLLTEAGVEVDDRTFVQKLKALENLSDLKSIGKEMYDAGKNLKTVIEAIAA
jgi:hypothetical protein